MLARRNFLIVGKRRALCLAAVNHEEAAEVTAMRIEQRRIHSRDPAVGLHAPEHLDELAEHLDGALLAPAHGRTEPYEQGPISHHDSAGEVRGGRLVQRPPRV